MSNFYARIAETAERHAARPAIEILGEQGLTTVSYADLMAESTRVAGWLAAAAGIRRGDRVAILSANDARWVAAYLAVLRIGGVAVPLDTAYNTAQIRTIVQDSGARLLCTSDRLHETAAAALDGEGAGSVRLARLSSDRPDAGDEAPLSVVEASDPAVILYTSGTTADPKGVVLTHANLEAERTSALAVIHVTDADAVLGVLPLFHALAQMANLLLPLSAGSRVVFLETINSTSLLGALQSRPITVFACVPQFFYLIHQRVTAEVAKRGTVARVAFRALVAGNGWLRDTIGLNLGPRLFARVHQTLGARMRMLITGGSRFDPAIARDLYGLGLTLLNGYGLTETSGAATVMRPGDRFTTSVGMPLPGVEIRIDRRSDLDAADGDDAAGTGEVLIRGGIVMQGYFHRADATAAALRDGWLHTGDLGYVDSEGRLFITGRLKEVIVLSSGKNLYPEEIEAHYRRSSFIKEICVLGLTRSDQPSAERLHAEIVPDFDALRARGAVNVRELVRFEVEGLSVQLPAHKRILSFDISRDPLPRTTTGKLKRSEIDRQVRARALRATADAPTDQPAPMTDDDQRWIGDPLRAQAIDAIARHQQGPRPAPSASLELDLGLDSMERVELLTALEAAHGRRVSPEVRATIFTVRDLVDAVLGAEPVESGPARHHASWSTLLSDSPDAAMAADLARPTLLRALVLYAGIRSLATLSRLGVRWRVEGRQHLPTAGPALLCPNHQSFLDGFYLAASLPFSQFRQLFLVGAAEYFQTPITRWIAHVANIVPVDADANLVAAMKAAAVGLRLGKILMLFPEGERTIDGDIKPFRKGAAILASHLSAPLVPVGVSGLFAIWPRGRSLAWHLLRPWRRPVVTIAFAPPIRPAGDDYEAISTDLQQRVAAVARLEPR